MGTSWSPDFSVLDTLPYNCHVFGNCESLFAKAQEHRIGKDLLGQTQPSAVVSACCTTPLNLKQKVLFPLGTGMWDTRLPKRWGHFHSIFWSCLDRTLSLPGDNLIWKLSEPAKNCFSSDAPSSLSSSLRYRKWTSSNLILLSVGVQCKEYQMYPSVKT